MYTTCVVIESEIKIRKCNVVSQLLPDPEVVSPTCAVS